MIREAVRHTGTYPDVYLQNRRTLVFRIRTARADVQRCTLFCFARTEPEKVREIPMVWEYRDELFDYYAAVVTFHQIARYQKYYFRFDDALYYSAHGFSQRCPTDGFFEFLYANTTDAVTVPAWARGQVFYQIFPERFCNGDRGNDPDGCMPWGSPPDRVHDMGGDLRGIIRKLPYLKELGVDCLYLNPVFKGDFNHKYATTDYFEVDPQFGTNEDLKELVERVHASGMRIILDGVFNHCGIHFEPFQDLLKNQEHSRYRDWFFVRDFPFDITHHDYECVGAYKYMPKLNSGNPEVRAFILRVMDFWISEFQIDGWRLDVADEVDESVWEMARIVLKQKHPDVLLLGETWGSGLRLMNGTQMDSIMNYVFRDAVRDFVALGAIRAEKFDARIQKMLSDYPVDMDLSMFLPLGSHDTERFLTLCGGDRRKMALAVVLQMSFMGSPSIYYGDECGMEGENDPDCRRCMIWEESERDQELYELYRSLIRIRKKEPALRTGRQRTMLCRKDVYGYFRGEGRDAIYILVNTGEDNCDLKVPVVSEGRFRVLLQTDESRQERALISTEKEAQQHFLNEDVIHYKGYLNVTLAPYSAVIFKEEQTKEGNL